LIFSGNQTGTITAPFTCTTFSISDGTNTITINQNYYSAPYIFSLNYDSLNDTTEIQFFPVLESIYYSIKEKEQSIW